jgi:hypothetical protein
MLDFRPPAGGACQGAHPGQGGVRARTGSTENQDLIGDAAAGETTWATITANLTRRANYEYGARAWARPSPEGGIGLTDHLPSV